MARFDAFGVLLAHDRVRAVALAPALAELPLLARRAAEALVFPTREALHQRLLAIGLAPHPEGHDLLTCLPDRTDDVTLKTRRDPVGHDHLIASWRHIAPDLDGVRFEELGALHPDDEASEDGRVHGVHRVRAFWGGRGVEGRLPERGSWVDLFGLVGLANTVLERRGSPTRLGIVDLGAESAWVLAAPRGAWRGLRESGPWS